MDPAPELLGLLAITNLVQVQVFKMLSFGRKAIEVSRNSAVKLLALFAAIMWSS